ncbi:hypothetical protein PR202_gb02204 [Eleusine coracana subsp. coracana]|uniref:Uncharacterized protein n=1 Tax=Eleusine coracana subsp. coracana TaxID=191504 RepID=A0AAV5DY40_ELECO|nr:hypothetical protein PR202_gb02204 [Eleusine coracana subsp. coracana]
MFFEINLKIKDDACGDDRVLSKDLGLEPKVDPDLHHGMESEVDTNLEYELESEIDTDLDSEFDRNSGFDTELDPDWDNHVVSWEEIKAKALHIVRMYQVTEYDPVHRIPVCARFCKYNLAYFDFDKECEYIHYQSIISLISRGH